MTAGRGGEGVEKGAVGGEKEEKRNGDRDRKGRDKVGTAKGGGGSFET